MPNVNDQSYAFTVITPIISGKTEGVVHEAELRSVLAQLSAQKTSPFARVAGTHFARWCIIDNTPQFAFPTHADPLKSKYLMLEADFDGDREQWIQGLLAVAPQLLTAIYSHCVGFPGVNDTAAFSRYLVRCQLNTTLDFAPFGTHPLPEIQRALTTQRLFVGFVREVQGRSPLELSRAFTDFIRRTRDTLPSS